MASVIILFLAASRNNAAAQDSQGKKASVQAADAKEKELVSFLMAGIRNSYERIQSGEFVALEEKTVTNDAGVKVRFLNEIRSAFDRGSKRVRHEFRRLVGPNPRAAVDPSLHASEHTDQSPASSPQEKERLENKKKIMDEKIAEFNKAPPTADKEKAEIIVESPEGAVVWNGGPRVDLLATKWDGIPDLLPFDPLAIGLCAPDELKARPRFTEIEAFLQDRVAKHEMTAMQEGHLYRLIMDFKIGKTGVRRLTTFDGDMGFAPIRTEISFTNLDTQKAIREPQALTTTWAKRGDAWVPVRFDAKRATKDGHTNWVITLDWRQINGTIDPEKFDYRKFDVPSNTRVVDSRALNGAPVIAEVLRAPRAREIAEQTFPKGSAPRRFTVLLIVNGIAVLGLASLAIWRWRHRS